MSATLGAAALSAGAGLIGSFFGAHKQDKNAQAQREWQEKMYLMDRDYNTAVNQRKRWEEAGLNPNLMMNGSAGSVSGSIPLPRCLTLEKLLLKVLVLLVLLLLK